jgi:hypothetical protein
VCDCRACSLTEARAPNGGPPKDPERTRATAIFSHVTADVCGPISPTSSGGLRYLMTFTCPRSRWKSVHYLETKDEALLALQSVGLGEGRHLRAGTAVASADNISDNSPSS